MKTILITAANSQTVISTIYSLRQAFYTKIIAVDRTRNTLSKHLVDVSIISGKSDKAHLAAIKKAIKKYKIDAIIPHSIPDRILLMQNEEKLQGVPVCSTNHESLIKAEDKGKFAKACEELDIPIPEQYVAKTAKDIRKYAKKLGYPEKKIIVKPVTSKGGRGFRILNEDVNFKAAFYTQKEQHRELNMNSLIEILGIRFPPLIISEYLPGKEYSVDCLNYEGHFLAIPRRRVETILGLTSYGRLEDNEELKNYAKRLTEKLGLTTVYGFQFKEDEEGKLKALECNPRIQGTMIMSTLAGANIIAACLKLQWGKKMPSMDIDWETEYQRIWGGISIGEKKTFLNIELR